jgi:hypothetical protein
MAAMQYRVRTLLLMTAFAGISTGGALIGNRMQYTHEPAAEALLLYACGMLGTLWLFMPLLFIAFAVGRKQLTSWMLIAFTIALAVSLGAIPFSQWIYEVHYPPPPPGGWGNP